MAGYGSEQNHRCPDRETEGCEVEKSLVLRWWGERLEADDWVMHISAAAAAAGGGGHCDVRWDDGDVDGMRWVQRRQSVSLMTSRVLSHSSASDHAIQTSHFHMVK